MAIRKNLTLDSADVDRVLALLDDIDQYRYGNPSEIYSRELAIADLAKLLRDAVMER